MKFGSPLPHKKARIEIIPLIDIMFFLLASFMMGSLTMINLQAIKMNLPTAKAATKDIKLDMVSISVDRNGDVYYGSEKRAVNIVELQNSLSNAFRINTNVAIYINGHKDATHGQVIRVLDIVKNQGIEKVSFAISPQSD